MDTQKYGNTETESRLSMTQFNLYIGANNQTGIVEIDKIVHYIGKVFEGFAIVNTSGYWQGKAEKSIIVTIFTDEKDRWFMIEYIKGLATILMQDCIILQTVQSNSFENKINRQGEMIIDFCVGDPKEFSVDYEDHDPDIDTYRDPIGL